MKSMWKMMCFVVVVGLCMGSSGYAAVLFSDTFECEAESDVQDLQDEACDAGRSGVYAASGYLQSPVGWTYQHQVKTTNELLLYDGKVTPNVDMSGSNSIGGFSVSVDILPARGLAIGGDWAGIVVGGSGLSDVWADGFGVLFRKNGTIQAWDNGAMLVNDTVTWNATPDDVYHNIKITATDATDGNPFDGVGTTTFGIFVDGSSVYSIDLAGADYPENYVTLHGQMNSYYDNLVISQFGSPDTVSNRYPGTGETLIPIDAVCSWNPPGNYTPEGYDVYVGTAPNNLTATAEYKSLGQTGTTFDPGGPTVDLAYETDYYWQVDALEPDGVGNPPIVHSSAVWKFTTRPFSSVLFSDDFDFGTNTTDLNAGLVGSGGRTVSGTYASTTTYVDTAGADTWRTQISNLARPGAMLLYGAAAGPNHNFNAGDSDGGLEVSVNMWPANGDPGSADWCGIVVGSDSPATLLPGTGGGFGILFKGNGNIQAWDGVTNFINDDVQWGKLWNGIDPVRVRIVATGLNDGNPFDGIDQTQIDVYVNGSLIVTRVSDNGDGYADNYVSLCGSNRNNMFENFSIDKVSGTPNINDSNYNDDFQVNFRDYLYFSEFWQQTAPQYNLIGDDLINIQDLAVFAQSWLGWQIPPDAETITIDPMTTFQEIEGFGASLTDSSAWLIYEFLNASERQDVLTDLFDPDDGIGLSYLRQPMGASDFRLQEYSYDDMPTGQTDYDLSEFSITYDENYIIPTLQEILAINPNVRIMGSPWSPPVWMKTSGQIGGGSLKSDVYPAYANYFVKYVQAYAAHGIGIDAVTLQNEPYHEPGSYAGCRMEPADQIKLVKEMGPAFQNNSISTKILVWDHNWDRPDYPIDVLNDSTARPYIDGVAWHHYGGNVSAQTTVHNAYPTKGAYFTEGSDGTWNDGGFDAVLIGNGVFIVEAIQNWAKTVIKWNLALDENNGPKIAGGCDTCYGVITINQSNRQVSPRPQYYALGHASKFLRPGAVRIASESMNVKTVAFKNTDGSIVLYAVNSNSPAHPLKLEWNNQWAISTIPPRSIMTFRWDDQPNAAVQVWLTTGTQTKLLSKEADVFFYNK